MRKASKRLWIAIAAVIGVVTLVAIRLNPGDTLEMVFPEPNRRAVFQMTQLEVAARRIWRDAGRPPATLDALVDSVLEAVVYRVDPWGNDFQVLAADTVFALRTLGADSIPGTWDDIVQASTLDTIWYVRAHEMPIAWQPRR